MAGYKEWIDNAEVKIDYFSAFLKAWIAFNAWYNFSGEIPSGNDQQCIEYISGQSNRFKTYIINLLSQDGSESKTYKDNLAKLHEALLNSPITSQEYFGFRQIVSFSEIAIKNRDSLSQLEYYGIKYSCKKDNKKIKTSIKEQSGKEIFYYEQDNWNIDELKQQSSFRSLTTAKQQKCEECYNNFKPYIISSVLCQNPPENHRNNFGAYSFVDNNERIAEAIVIVLYMLRCCLAHGDITPDRKTSDVYRYAYEVLLAPLSKLE